LVEMCRLYLCLFLILLIVILKIIWWHSTSGGTNTNALPVVLWHGMGDTCCLPLSLGAIMKLIVEQTNGTYVRSLEIGDNPIMDWESGIFLHPQKQLDYVCKTLLEDEKLAKGYNAIGFSQGAQFLRAVAQKCPKPPMRNLISIGGQHQGIFGLPMCSNLEHELCENISRLLTNAAYSDAMQDNLVQATYWHDPLRENLYRHQSTFLSEFNNEVYSNIFYTENLNKLKRFVMVKFLNDTVVQPKESEWFEFYTSGQDKVIQPLEQSAVYKNLGLDKMHENGKLIFLGVAGDHLVFSHEWFIENIVPILNET
ncbi:hypothetical protein KR018_008033, partial [Drosophila ironensis]